jgi:hypothetical protein
LDRSANFFLEQLPVGLTAFFHFAVVQEKTGMKGRQVEIMEFAPVPE